MAGEYARGRPEVKQPKEPRTIKGLEAELKSARHEIQEYRGFRDSHREEVAQLKKSLADKEQRIRVIAQSAFQQRTDLDGRIQRLDQIIRACGYLAPGDPKPSDRCNTIASHSEWREVGPE